ncbi:hypothetical protein Efla_003040 [Eimeria flavescens]
MGRAGRQIDGRMQDPLSSRNSSNNNRLTTDIKDGKTPKQTTNCLFLYLDACGGFPFLSKAEGARSSSSSSSNRSSSTNNSSNTSNSSNSNSSSSNTSSSGIRVLLAAGSTGDG